MLIHSYIYYKLGTSIVTDEQFDRWAIELVELQAVDNPNIHWYDNEFADWDGSSGFHLPQDAWVSYKAHQLLNTKGIKNAVC